MTHSKLELIAHRGHMHRYPENTLIALSTAIGMGAHYVEFDIQLSADQIPVLMHDQTLGRTCARADKVWALTAKELNHICANESERYKKQFPETMVPLLSDVITLMNKHPQIGAFVELKRESLNHFGRDVVIERVVEVMKKAEFPWTLISYDFETVKDIQDLGRSPVGWVLQDYDEHTRQQAVELAPDYLLVNQRKIPLSGELWSGCWRWAVYDVLSIEVANALHGRGVDLIESGAVDRLMV